MKDWAAWHADYDDPSSFLNVRLRAVQERLAQAIDASPAGPVQLVSLCAGQGRDVIGVLSDHPRREDVRALLVEFDAGIAEVARQAAALAELPRVEVRVADAGEVSSFADALPADVLLLCGIFGNVSDDDIHRTVQAAAACCRPGATVIWTRHRLPPDLTPQIREWFAASGFDEVGFDVIATDAMMSVGAGRLTRAPAAKPAAGRLFRFRSG
jgi:Putative methyltransferase